MRLLLRLRDTMALAPILLQIQLDEEDPVHGFHPLMYHQNNIEDCDILRFCDATWHEGIHVKLSQVC